MDRTSNGHVEEHKFYDGYDLWGYDMAGIYNSAYDRAPFQRSPFRPADES
ncbi:hypothetical protein [Mycobacteroides chelonae]|nr:hypothetical protein [Mycobacteroides chelonae]